MQGHFYKPNCKCEGKKTKKCSCGATWSYIIDVGINPATGKRKQRKKGGFKTKDEAQTAAALALSELAQGVFVEEKKDTFEQFAEEWLTGYKNSGRVKISTVNIRRYEIDCFLKHIGKAKLKDITKRQYQSFLNDLHKQGHAISTIRGVHNTGQMIFRKAIEMDVIKNDPTKYAVVPQVQKTVAELEQNTEMPNYLEKEELALLIDTAKQYGRDRDYIIFLTLAYTGMRVGELCALKWSDIDFEEQTISITKTCYNPNNNTRKYILLTPKTKKSIRTIDTDRLLVNELKIHQVVQNRLKMLRRDIYHDEGFVFAQTNRYPGYPAYIKLIEIRMRRLLRLSKLDTSLTPHSLRHTHTSLLAEAGVSLEQIMHRLGHSDDATTKNIYLHITKPKRKEASQKFAELMRGI